MKKVVLVLLIAFFTGNFGFAADLKWYSWDEGYELAKKENKNMLVFVVASWCHVCGRMEKNTFMNDEVATTLNKNFVPVKFDIDQKDSYNLDGKELNQGEFLSSLTKGSCYGVPASIFFNPKSKKSTLEMGYKDVEQFKKLLEEF